MQENKFEKQVQHKLYELKIDPSDAVWQNVYAKIKVEKQRRRELILIPFLFFLCTGILVWFPPVKSPKNGQELSNKIIAKKNSDEMRRLNPASTNINTEAEKGKKTFKVKDNKRIDKTTGVHSNLSLAGGDTSQARPPRSVSPLTTVPKTFKAKANKRIDQTTITTGIVKTRNNKIVYEKSPDIIPLNLSEKNNKSNNLVKSETQAEVEAQYLKDEKIIINKQDTNDQKKEISQNNLQANSIKNQRDTLLSPVIAALKPINQKATEGLAVKKGLINNTKANKAKWNWGIAFSAGVSDISQSFLGSDFLGYGAEEKSYFADASRLYSSAPQGGTGTDTLSKKPYIIKPSLALNIGVFAIKKVSKNLSVTLGINYKPYSTTNKIGQKVDSGRFYRIQNPINRYKSYYHFIEVPVAFSLQLKKPKNIPLVLNGGISVSQLIASNALQFNSTAGLYYYDNSIFNKTHIGFNTGIYFSNKKNSMLLGPHIYYNLTKISNEGLYKNAHFTYLGFHSRFLLKNK